MLNRRAVLSVLSISLIACLAPAAAQAAGTATYTKGDDWGTGFVAGYTLKNTGTTPLTGWKLEFDVPAGTSITGMWNGRDAAVGGHHVVTAEDWNGTIAPGASIEIGFQGSSLGTFAGPTGCKLNGGPCTGGTTPPPVTPPPVTPPPATGSYAATLTKGDDWGTGYTAGYTVKNTGSAPVTGWKVEFDLPATEQVTSAWSSVLAKSGNHYTLTAADWNKTIPAGGSVQLGFQVVRSAPVTPPPVDPPPVDPPPVDPPAGGSAKFAPYVDMTLWPQFSMADAIRNSPTRKFSLGFVVSGQPCTPSWGGYYGVTDPWITDSLAAMRAAGGSAIVSFGGAANQELALTCSSVDSLAAAYQKVIDAHGIRDIDFDIEGSAQADAPSLDRRSKAVAKVQAAGRAAGKPVTVSLTLPVMPTGLTDLGLNTVRSAANNGVELDVVNVMAMDYYDPSLNVNGHMGDLAIQAATSLQAQLKTIYPAKTDAQLWRMVGVTPMIGVNDNPAEIFTVADATKLAAFAKSKGIGRLAMWSANRDSQCPGALGQLSNTCSGTTQSPWGFSTALSAIG